MFRTIKSIVKEINWNALTRKSFWWFFTMHIPWIICCLIDAIRNPGYKNLLYNTKVWDGATRNDFKKGNLVQFLYQLRIIQQPKSYDSSDGRGYFIGYQDDEE